MYFQFARFILPLAITIVAVAFSGQVINSGLARSPRAVESLAAFALAWGIIEFFGAAIYPLRQVSLVLAEDGRALRKIYQFVIGVGVLSAAIIGGLVYTPAGSWVLEDVHGADSGLSAVVSYALVWMIPLPLLDGLIRVWSGVLMRLRRTEIVAAASIAEIGAMMAVVPVVLPTDFVQNQPIGLAILATYAGKAASLAILLWGHLTVARPILNGISAQQSRDPITVAYLWRFFWPLSMTIASQGASRPLVNLFVSRSPGGEEALAVLAVVYALTYLPYGWLNDLRAVVATFSITEENVRDQVRRFAVRCMLAMTARTPQYSLRREDVASRTVVLTLRPLEEKRSEHEIATNIGDKRDLLLSDYAKLLQKSLAVPLDTAEAPDPGMRLADFARVAVRLARGLGPELEEIATNVLLKVRQSQFKFATEEDDLSVALSVWIYGTKPRAEGEMDVGAVPNNDRQVLVSDLLHELKVIAEANRFPLRINNPEALGRRLRNMEAALSPTYDISTGRGRINGRIGTWWQFTLREIEPPEDIFSEE